MIVKVVYERYAFIVPECNKQIIRVFGIKRLLKRENPGIFLKNLVFIQNRLKIIDKITENIQL